MSATFPRLRSDLIVSRQETPGGVVFVVKDPTVGRFVRFREPEYFIARQFDGQTPLEEVRRRGETELGGSLSDATVRQFAGKLLNLGLLDHSIEGQHEVPARRELGKFRGNVFYLRFKVFDPDKLFEKLLPRVRFAFTRQFAWFSLGIILFAALVTVLSWPEIHRSLPRLYRVESLVLAWLTFVSIVVGHEFSHGLTCKYFGGRVHEVGMLLIFLQPGMYCNVSDAWLFPEKSKRLLVTLAGAWFEIFCWAVATLVWRVTDPATLLNYLAMVVATTLGIKSLFNLNPLIKLDGYYLLSDFLEIPNLRRNAFTHIARSWKRRGPEASESAGAGPRERRIYWLYGLLAAAYSSWLLSFLLLALGGFLMRRYQSWGFIAFGLFLTLFFRSPLRKVGRFLASLCSPKQGILRVVKRFLKIAVVLVAVSAALYFIPAQLKISGEFRILPIHNADVRADVEGVIEEIFRDEGDEVKAGDIIARLSDRDYQAELSKVQSEIAEKGARLRLLKAGPRAEEIDLLKTTVIKGEERLKYAESFLGMEKSLYEGKLSSKKDYEEAAELAALRRKELEESRGNLKLLLAGSRPETIEATEAELARLTSQQKYLGDQLRRLQIVSPIAGVVTTHRLKERLGATLKKGDLVAEVHEVKTVTAEISVPEKEISDVKVGQPVVLKARAHLGTSFQGQVFSISPVASKPAEGLVQREFLVVTRLENADFRLKPEMTGNAKIYCGQRRLYEIVFRRLIRFVRVEFWSWW
jgi:multidrug efflux pump subunit AcrA (membrane-fusion protein)